ncbi:hypothetical protein ACHHYP_20314 [Achlya hypogyna]|uniref:SET and MYND domain-containing protein n=1 Tax=Achlya hypogyna TaxID=1202772 RepID=A0A1V9YRC1_ACHHY|nr:hypothetical protein ACHHYP_20314 [Achlya hypogyna]
MAVQLETRDRGAGRWVSATRAFAPGDLVLESAPFAFALLPSLWTERCQSCFEPGSLARCGRCKLVYYCSKGCQQTDWRTHHKFECPRLNGLVQSVSGDMIAEVLLVARTLRTLSDPSATPQTPPPQSVAPTDLVWFEEDHGGVARTAAVVESSGLLPSHVSYSRTEIEQMLCRAHVNNFVITDDLLLDVGAGCFPWGAMINHSCLYNCFTTFAPKTHVMQLRAVRHIAAGEEITHAYVDVALPSSKRQRQLQAQYHFACACERCASPTDLAASYDRPDERTPALEQARELVAGAARAPAAEAVVRLERALALRQAALPKSDVGILEVHSQLLTHYIDEGDLEKALRTATTMATFYEKLYPQPHALAGLHLYTLGDLGAQLASHRLAAAQHLQQAKRILNITHGTQHRLVQALAARIADVRRP